MTKTADVETICGYKVHPAASIFPLIEGDDFYQLCESIRTHGVQHAAIVRGSELLDGRNRMRACEALKQEGWSGSCPVVEWKDNGRNVAGWIWDTNALRRHMDDDGLAMASAAVWPLIAEENKANKKATQQKAGQPSINPAGRRGKEPETTKTSSPVNRDRKTSDARSTVGQVAAKAKTSIHKARQAVAVQKAIKEGMIPADTAQAVISGKKKLKDVLPKKPRKKKHRAMKLILVHLRDLIAEWRNADYDLDVLREELATQLERI